ncbi:MAG: hypothetical protein PWR06_1044 [Thermoanaerobacteraceae bacterium]|jgi:ABC-type molybdate transport system substrate-binding protein|nr:hypothetical protein [Biomaibacter acetigenes]MDK2878328.1 hypothetical protein [Thermoanaerobacteraceae bacterium]MDN5301624.1 hypothetical protein [Thermoanaerobacteraceae bacterium]MDN5311487.1 hypothetical protein [Thermoanaerobacteraceae bacterium]
MRRFKRLFAVIAVILIGVMLIVGCGQKSSGGSGGQKQEKKVIDAGGAS